MGKLGDKDVFNKGRRRGDDASQERRPKGGYAIFVTTHDTVVVCM